MKLPRRYARQRRDDVLVPEFPELVPRTQLKVPGTENRENVVDSLKRGTRLDLVPGLDGLVPEMRGTGRRANAAGVGCEPADA